MQVLMARAVVQIVKFIVWLETREDNDFNETESNILFYQEVRSGVFQFHNIIRNVNWNLQR